MQMRKGTNFSVAAWVQLASLNNWATAVSQDGANVSGFYLQCTSPSAGSDGSKFAFSLINTDATTGTTVRATSPFTPLVNTWYHLVGVYDATNQRSHLYVNGTLAGTQTIASNWNATGETVIGRAKFGGPTDYWPGLIDDVQLYSQALVASDILTLYQTAPSQTPVRPPSVPLIVRSPYVSTWQNTSTAPGSWSTFWNGNVKAITGIVRIDGTSYVFFGAPGGIGTVQNATQIQLEVTATQSRYIFQAGTVDLYVNFVSPIEATNMNSFLSLLAIFMFRLTPLTVARIPSVSIWISQANGHMEQIRHSSTGPIRPSIRERRTSTHSQ